MKSSVTVFYTEASRHSLPSHHHPISRLTVQCMIHRYSQTRNLTTNTHHYPLVIYMTINDHPQSPPTALLRAGPHQILNQTEQQSNSRNGPSKDFKTRPAPSRPSRTCRYTQTTRWMYQTIQSMYQIILYQHPSVHTLPMTSLRSIPAQTQTQTQINIHRNLRQSSNRHSPAHSPSPVQSSPVRLNIPHTSPSSLLTRTLTRALTQGQSQIRRR